MKQNIFLSSNRATSLRPEAAEGAENIPLGSQMSDPCF